MDVEDLLDIKEALELDSNVESDSEEEKLNTNDLKQLIL